MAASFLQGEGRFLSLRNKFTALCGIVEGRHRGFNRWTASDSLHSLIKVVENVVDVFDADGDSYETVCNADGLASFFA